MSACVFLGPTLPLADARRMLEVDYLPPVRQGAVYDAVTRLRPRVIGIVDGYFHQVPSVWHKEILWAMAQGVHVFGSASMGALRAAELEPFGMRGVGAVFDAFRNGEIEDDDEVAVIHGPPEIGYAAASEAMVNIRRTLADAAKDGIVGTETRDALIGIAKSLHYPKRAYAALLQQGKDSGLPLDELSALGDWLAGGRVDQKREDALAMLGAIRELLEADPAPQEVEYGFEHTTMWAAATAAIDVAMDAAGDAGTDDADRAAREWLLDEVRLDAEAYAELRRAALLRLLARREAQRSSVELSNAELRQCSTEFRMSHGLHRARDLDRWLSDRNLDRPGWERYIEDEAVAGRLGDAFRAELDRFIVDALRMSRRYGELFERANAKREALEGSADDGDVDGFEELRALAWYFEHRVGARVPDDVDAYASRLGFASSTAFRRAVRREYRFRRADDGGRDA